jgi:hypothetical protein
LEVVLAGDGGACGIIRLGLVASDTDVVGYTEELEVEEWELGVERV